MLFIIWSCKKNNGSDDDVTPVPKDISLSFTVNGAYNSTLNYTGLNKKPVIQFQFTEAVNPATITNGIKLADVAGTGVAITTSLQNEDKTLQVVPQANLNAFTSYQLIVNNNIQSSTGGKLVNPVLITLKTGIDSAYKFPLISDNALLDLVQRQTFKYFWDFGHPTSGLAKERNTPGDLVTSGGSGFGIMAIVAGISRNFITRAQGLSRMQTIVGFLKNTAQKFHGAFPHWLNGNTGAVIPFSAKDNGADLVETSYLIQGILTARQYFNGADAAETALRNDINQICNGVEWSWFRKSNENVLYWHWSNDYNWDMNVQIKGWNECLITYVLAASSTNYTIPKAVYDNGWASNGGIIKNNTHYSYQLPLGPSFGGPLFFAHYSFLGINPNNLTDAYANYFTQNRNHTLINYTYCKTNPANYYGYSDSVWGLTASDIPNGYTASSPTNDRGVIAPTAALSSFPYTPEESMKALKFFYYVLGDKIWKEYGFVDAFSLHEPWFAGSFLAIDQGPIIIMIENYRSGLLWNLFMSCPEIKAGMLKLGFQSPHL